LCNNTACTHDRNDWALLHNLVAGARVGVLTAYLGRYEQAFARPLPHDELV
jgi:hypothetical protein